MAMTPRRRFIGIMAILLIGLVAYGARIGSAQEGGIPVATPGASPDATPMGTVPGDGCAGTGSMPGLRVVLTIDERLGQTITPDLMDRTMAILARRAASVSPAGCDIVVEADGSIQVTLTASPALDADAAVSTLSESARLEIVDTGGTFPEVGTPIDPEAALLEALGIEEPAATPGSEPYPAILTGSDIADAYAVIDASGIHQVVLALTEDAAARFARYTAAHIGEPLAIVLDGDVVSVPVIQAEIGGGEVVIQGNYTAAEALTLATQLRAGALPVTLDVASVQLTPDGRAEDVPIGEVDGVEIFTVGWGDHSTDPIDYPQSPPIGGMHDPAWQNCGFYDAPVRSEHAVHSLEHGVVWITYQPDLAPVQVDALRQLTLVNDRLLVSPYPDLDGPIVLSTWDRQLRLDTVDDPRLFEFIETYTDRAPEVNGRCQDGVSTPA